MNCQNDSQMVNHDCGEWRLHKFLQLNFGEQPTKSVQRFALMPSQTIAKPHSNLLTLCIMAHLQVGNATNLDTWILIMEPMCVLQI